MSTPLLFKFPDSAIADLDYLREGTGLHRSQVVYTALHEMAEQKRHREESVYTEAEEGQFSFYDGSGGDGQDQGGETVDQLRERIKEIEKRIAEMNKIRFDGIAGGTIGGEIVSGNEIRIYIDHPDGTQTTLHQGENPIVIIDLPADLDDFCKAKADGDFSAYRGIKKSIIDVLRELRDEINKRSYEEIRRAATECDRIMNSISGLANHDTAKNKKLLRIISMMTHPDTARQYGRDPDPELFNYAVGMLKLPR